MIAIRRAADFVRIPLLECEEECRSLQQSPEGRRVDWQVIAVLLATALLMTVQYYALYRGTGIAWLMQITGRNSDLWQRVFWAMGQVAVYVPIPLALICLFPRRSLRASSPNPPVLDEDLCEPTAPVLRGLAAVRDYGVKWKQPFACWWVYALMYLTLLPAVIYVSRLERFQATYPFLRMEPGEPLWPKLIVWELLYAAQFVALEFFFRGFLLHGIRRRFGAYSILVMTVPYCMIHFGKPVQETIGAIVAGLLLGFMSLKTRSIWMGALLHIAVAWTMDAIALARAGYWFS